MYQVGATPQENKNPSFLKLKAVTYLTSITAYLYYRDRNKSLSPNTVFIIGFGLNGAEKEQKCENLQG